jgi:uncharacterized protein DUF6218
MIGHVVVRHGRDENDRDAVAVWHVDAAGDNTGAWVLELDLAEPAPDSAGPRRDEFSNCVRGARSWRGTRPRHCPY